MNEKKFDKEKKAHWQSYELKGTAEEQELKKQEYFTSPDPLVERIKSGKFDRKGFLTLMGAGVAMTTMNCFRRPVEKIVPYVDLDQPTENAQYDYVQHGKSNYFASVCGGCSAGCGILVKTRQGRPLKIEGNPEHPVSQGAICAMGQAATFNLYDPDRAQGPMEISGGKGKKTKWAAVDKKVTDALAANRGKTVLLTAPVSSPSSQALINSFLSGVGGGKHLQYDAISSEEAISKAQGISYGKELVPEYHFDQAKAILSIDCDFMGGWISPVQYQKDFSKRRELKNGEKDVNVYIAAETMPTMTGSNADRRIPLRSGDQKKFALAVGKSLASMGAPYGDAVAAIDLDKVAKELGISKESIENTAKALWSARGASLVVAGGPASQTKDAVELQVAVNLLNSMLGNDGKTVDSSRPRKVGSVSATSDLKTLKADLKAKRVGVLILNNANLLYQQPDAEEWKSLLKNAALVVAVSDRIDETAKEANLLAASTHFLEEWGDSEPVQGIQAVRQPTIRPIADTRSLEDSLIQWSGGEISGAKTYYDYVLTRWTQKLGSKRAWEDLLREGTTLKASNYRPGASGGRGFRNGGIGKVSSAKEGQAYLTLYATVGLGDGKNANNSILLELPDPVTKVTWDNYIAISPQMAKDKGLRSNDVASLKLGSKTIELPVQVQPGMHKDSVAIPLGFGRSAAGKVANGVGKNSYILADQADAGLAFSGLPVSIEKTGKTYKLACTQHHHLMAPGHGFPERPLIQSTTIDKYKKDPKSGLEETEFPKVEVNGKTVNATGLNPGYEYPGYRWGMSIDLTQCTGCSACVVACQVENNIPVVGRDEVRVGREMHWIRIDRYYIGHEDDPESMEIAHQPVPCQHCENAPCETVCPVLATVHGSEGTNDMIYNRCVGTRYCSNNCPYKVRRFNWMQHWYGGTKLAEAPRNQGLNPDVTVRGRGVMEKCTFCSSRIAEKKFAAKNEGRKLKDGELKTACQQTCPSDAIRFGDINDSESVVSKYQKDPRSYKIIEYLNTRPVVTYMTRVRNRA